MKKMLLAFAVTITINAQSSAQAFYRYFGDSGYYKAAAHAELRVLKLFPNPATNDVSVVLNYLPEKRTYIEIVDFNGQMQRSFAFNPGGRLLTFNVSFLQRGYYVVRVREGSRLIDVLKMVKN